MTDRSTHGLYQDRSRARRGMGIQSLLNVPIMHGYDKPDQRTLATALSVGMAAANAWLVMSERQSEFVSISGMVVGGSTIIAAVIGGGDKTIPMLTAGMASLALRWMALERGNQVSVTTTRSF